MSPISPHGPIQVEPAVSGGARLVARDWPFAGWTAAPLLAAGIPLLAWSVAGRHAIEGGGALVFTALGALAAWLALTQRRDLVVVRERGTVRIRGREGAGPFARDVDVQFPAATAVEVVPFAVPEGAPGLTDRGGDLVLSGGGARFRLARRVGPGWKDDLDAAARTLRAALGNEDSTSLPA